MSAVRPVPVPEVAKVVDLSQAGRGNFQQRRGFLVRALWYVIERAVLYNHLMPLTVVRVALLRVFGARIGKNCRLPHAVRVKFPWNLQVGDNCWFGEDVWIYNQDQVRIGSHVCVSQGTFLTTGTHDLATNMDLRVAPIVIEDGAWITSRCVVQMGVNVGRSVVVTPMSVVHKSLEPAAIYGGNPCKRIRDRF
jgi:putative colanic acid biosynthesis acetyltransferase WcaF